MTNSSARARVFTYRIGAVLLGAQFGAILAWFMVEWPEPMPTLPRVLGWTFFVTLGALLAVCVREGSL